MAETNHEKQTTLLIDAVEALAGNTKPWWTAWGFTETPSEEEFVELWDHLRPLLRRRYRRWASVADWRRHRG